MTKLFAEVTDTDGWLGFALPLPPSLAEVGALPADETTRSLRSRAAIWALSPLPSVMPAFSTEPGAIGPDDAWVGVVSQVAGRGDAVGAAIGSWSQFGSGVALIRVLWSAGEQTGAETIHRARKTQLLRELCSELTQRGFVAAAFRPAGDEERVAALAQDRWPCAALAEVLGAVHG